MVCVPARNVSGAVGYFYVHGLCMQFERVFLQVTQKSSPMCK